MIVWLSSQNRGYGHNLADEVLELLNLVEGPIEVDFKFFSRIFYGFFIGVSEQQIRGVKVKLECRCVEELKPRQVFLQVTDEGSVRGTTDPNCEKVFHKV